MKAKYRVLLVLFSLFLASGVTLLFAALVQAYTDDIQPGEIVINEVMWGPEGTETLREWFEVKNVSDRDLDLGGCRLTDGTYTVTVSSPTTVTSGSYFVFCRRQTSTSSEVQECNYEYGSIGLNQSGDSITITCGITAVDSVNFSPWPAGTNDVSAMAFNLRPNQGDTVDNAVTLNDQGDRWCEASSVYTYTDGTTTDLGTPGEKNDVCTSWNPNAIALLDYRARSSLSLPHLLLGLGTLLLGAALWVSRRRRSQASAS